MTNGNGLVGKWKEFSMYSLDHGLIDSPEFKEIHQSYTDWYNSDEDNGTKVPKEGGSKYQAGIEIYQRMDDLLNMWEGAFNTTNKEEVIVDNEKKDAEVKIPISAKIIIGSAVVGNATGRTLNKVATKAIVPAAKATGHWVATDGKDGAVTIGRATKAGWKAFIAGLKNRE